MSQQVNTRAKCRCQNCSTKIEFDAVTMPPGTTVQCPHCQVDTILYIPAPEAAAPPPQKTKSPFILITAAALILLLAAAFLLSHPAAKTPATTPPAATSTNTPGTAPARETITDFIPHPAALRYPPLDDKLIQGARARLATMEISQDKVEATTDYKSANSGDLPLKLTLSRYDSGRLLLLAHIIYVGESWIFFDSVILRIDGQRIELPLRDKPARKILESGNVLEIAVQDVPDDIEIYDKILHSKTCTMRLQGSGGYEDYDLAERTRLNIGEMLLAYRYFGGNFPAKSPRE